MTPEEARRVHVNHALSDADFARLQAILDDIDPGVWQYNEAAGRVERYGGKPIERPGSYRFMAAAYDWVPRLVRWARSLEEALLSSWANASILRRELMEERERHEQDLLRNRAGQTGPEHELVLIAEAVQLGCYGRPALLAKVLGLWAAGGATQEMATLRVDIEGARARAAENKRIREEIDASDRRDREEVRALLAALKLTPTQRKAIFDHARAEARRAAKDRGGP
jgi:hypothetical protein